LNPDAAAMLARLPPLIRYALIMTLLLGLSWLSGKFLGLFFTPDPDPSANLIAGFGLLMIVGMVVGGIAAARSKPWDHRRP
jgi:hypothetical protein